MADGIRAELPLDSKPLLTLREASTYIGIGINKLRDMSNERNCEFVLFRLSALISKPQNIGLASDSDKQTIKYGTAEQATVKAIAEFAEIHL